MTPTEFKKKMQKIWDINDTECAHQQADDLMCEVLRKLGYGEGIDIFDEEEKWYA